MSTNRQKRIDELNALADDEGIALPWPAPVIVSLEDRCFYVDLTSGLTGSDQERVSSTVLGEAVVAAGKGEE